RVGWRVGGARLVLPRTCLVVVAEVRLTGVVAVSGMERARRQRHRLAPRQTAVVRELPRDLGDIAARVDILVVVENVEAAGVGVDGHPREPLRTILAGTAVQVNRPPEPHPALDAALEPATR